MHGGASTGPRTQAGLQRLRDARTIHGFHVKHVPDAFDVHVARILERGRLMVLLSKSRLPWPLCMRELAQLPPLPDPPDVPPPVRAAIQRLCDDLEARWREKASPKTPCTERKPNRRGFMVPPALHFAPWSIPPPGDPWGMSIWPDQVLGPGKAMILPPEIGPPRTSPG